MSIRLDIADWTKELPLRVTGNKKINKLLEIEIDDKIVFSDIHYHLYNVLEGGYSESLFSFAVENINETIEAASINYIKWWYEQYPNEVLTFS